MGEHKVKFETDNSTNSTRLYLNEIGRIDLIDRDKEAELALTIRAAVDAQEILRAVSENPNLPLASLTSLSTEDLEQTLRLGYESKEYFINANLRLVVSIAKKFARTSVDMIDLVQEGNIALIDAVDKFDPDMGNKFSTFAFARIFSAMQRGVATQGRTIRIPKVELKRLGSYKRIYSELRSRDPSMDELEIKARCADIMQLSSDELYDLEVSEYMLSQPASLNVTYGEDGTATLGDLIGVIDQSLEVVQNTGLSFEQLIKNLRPRQAEALRLRFIEERSLAEIGRIMGISKERVVQLCTRGVYDVRDRILDGEYEIDPDDSPALAGLIAKERATREEQAKPKY